MRNESSPGWNCTKNVMFWQCNYYILLIIVSVLNEPFNINKIYYELQSWLSWFIYLSDYKIALNCIKIMTNNWYFIQLWYIELRFLNKTIIKQLFLVLYYCRACFKKVEFFGVFLYYHFVGIFLWHLCLASFLWHF